MMAATHRHNHQRPLMCNPPRFVMLAYVEVDFHDEQVEDAYAAGFGFVH